MAPDAFPALSQQRLAEQLQRLCEVSESLTYRLLEVEERLVACERRLGCVEEAAQPGNDQMLERLGDTEDRLQRLEGLLQAPVGGLAGTGLHVLDAQAAA